MNPFEPQTYTTEEAIRSSTIYNAEGSTKCFHGQEVYGFVGHFAYAVGYNDDGTLSAGPRIACPYFEAVWCSPHVGTLDTAFIQPGEFAAPYFILYDYCTNDVVGRFLFDEQYGWCLSVRNEFVDKFDSIPTTLWPDAPAPSPWRILRELFK